MNYLYPIILQIESQYREYFLIRCTRIVILLPLILHKELIVSASLTTTEFFTFSFCFLVFFFFLLYSAVYCADKDVFPFPASKDITKTCLYNFDPLKPHFYVVKLGFTGVYIFFLISVQKHRLWVIVRTASARRF